MIHSQTNHPITRKKVAETDNRITSGKMEEDIIQPVDRRLLKSELTPEKQLRMTNKSHNEIYIVTAQNSPHVMKEIGRLREIAFRNAGGGTGKAVDIDEFDTMDGGYKQLIVWNPDAEDIIGGYRFLYGTDWKMNANGQPLLATSHMFRFSEKFLNEYMPYTVELGRSFVAVEYQSIRKGAKSIFALDNLWDGLGALTVINPNLKYFFGKMTMYPSYIRRGRDMILYFLKKHFDDKENLITPMKPLIIETDPRELEALFCQDDFKEDYKILNREIRALGYNIPPLVNAYMGLSPTMKLFGTAINNGFGDVEETGILIAVDEILEEKRVRHIDSFIQANRETLELTTGLNKIIYREKV
jgi:hemolysin